MLPCSSSTPAPAASASSGWGSIAGIDRFTGSILYDEKIGGTIHLALGQSYPETGGMNQSALHWDLIVDTRTDGQSLPTAAWSCRTDSGWWASSTPFSRRRRIEDAIVPRNEKPWAAWPQAGSQPAWHSSAASVAFASLGASFNAMRPCAIASSSSSTGSTLPTKQAQDAAQASLIKLGPKILTLLPDAATAKTPERKQRLEKIRATLKDMEPDITTTATKVTIQAKGIRLSEALQQLQKQSGNAITDLRDQLGADVTNPAIDLDIKDKGFFEALDTITRLAEVTTTYATGDGTIGIMAGASDGSTTRHARSQESRADGAVHRPVPH